MSDSHPSRRDVLVTMAAATLARSVPSFAQARQSSGGSSGRPDIMFLHNQNLPWQPHKLRGSGCQRRLFSRNASTGAETFTMKLAPGYKLEGPAALGADFEFFVVNGEVEINGIKYHRDCYAMHPVNYVHRIFNSPKGATLIVITVGGPDAIRRTAAGDHRKDRFVEIIDNWERNWKFGANPAWYPGNQLPSSKPGSGPKAQPGEPVVPQRPNTCSKQLWEDPDNKGSTFLYAGVPYPFGTFTTGLYSHTVDAEYFILQGDYIIGSNGRMTPGSYCAWKTHAMHGPSASEFGFYALIKYYGPIINEHDPKVVDPALSFDPPNKPLLPPELAKFNAPREMPEWWNMTLPL